MKSSLSKHRRQHRNPFERRTPKPVLRFSPYAWAKLLFFRDHGDTEVGGFGITPFLGMVPRDVDMGLYVEDFVTVRQLTSAVTVAFEDDAVADFYDRQVDLDRQPSQFSRVWIHTHPGSSAMPSSVDEETFARVFGQSDWAVMFILARGGQTYARLRFNTGPGADVRMRIEIDYSHPFGASNHAEWLEEFTANVHPGRPGHPGLPMHGDDLMSPFWDPRLESIFDEEPSEESDFHGSVLHRAHGHKNKPVTTKEPHD